MGCCVWIEFDMMIICHKAMNKSKFVSHKKIHNKWMEDPKYSYEYEKLEPEFQIAKTIVEARVKKKLS